MSFKPCLIFIFSCINFVAYGSDIPITDQNIFQKYTGMDSAFIRDSVISDLKRRKEIRTTDQMISSFTFMSISVDSSSNHVSIAVPNNVNCSTIHPQSSDSILIVKSNSFYAEIRFLNDTCASVICNGENEQIKTYCKMIRTSPIPTVRNWC